MGQKLSTLFREFEKMCAPTHVDWRDFQSVMEEEARLIASDRRSSQVHAQDEQKAFERLLEAFEHPEDPPPDWGSFSHVVATFRPLGVYGMLMAWQCQEQGELHDNAKWTRAYINRLPDTAFLYIESGGHKDEAGKTVPRSLRHFPYKSHSGQVDIPHLRDALSRIPQSHVSQRAQDEATRKAQKIYAQHGGYERLAANR